MKWMATKVLCSALHMQTPVRGSYSYMKNSLGLPWQGSAFSSFFFSTGAVVGAPTTGKLPEIPMAACFALGIKVVPPTEEVLKEVVDGAEFEAGSGANAANPAKLLIPAGCCYVIVGYKGTPWSTFPHYCYMGGYGWGWNTFKFTWRRYC